jgi:hypothetical protein
MTDLITPATILNRKGITARSKALRSRVSNRSSLFVATGDGRTAWARRLRDVAAGLAEDLGGVDNLTEAKRALIRRAAVIVAELERYEAKFSARPPRPEDFAGYLSATTVLSRLLGSLGLERVPKDVTPDLQTYLASKQQLEGDKEPAGAGGYRYPVGVRRLNNAPASARVGTVSNSKILALTPECYWSGAPIPLGRQWRIGSDQLAPTDRYQLSSDAPK